MANLYGYIQNSRKSGSSKRLGWTVIHCHLLLLDSSSGDVRRWRCLTIKGKSRTLLGSQEVEKHCSFELLITILMSFHSSTGGETAQVYGGGPQCELGFLMDLQTAEVIPWRKRLEMNLVWNWRVKCDRKTCFPQHHKQPFMSVTSQRSIMS